MPMQNLRSVSPAYLAAKQRVERRRKTEIATKLQNARSRALAKALRFRPKRRWSWNPWDWIAP